MGTVKPLLGAPPFHRMEDDFEHCAFCGASAKDITDQDMVFCPTVLEANKKAMDIWMRTIKEGVDRCHVDLTGVLADLAQHI